MRSHARRILAALASTPSLVLAPPLAGQAALPDRPRVVPDPTPPATYADTVHVSTAAQLQTALAAAVRGTLILLAPGVDFGRITLSPKAGTGWLTIRTDLSPAGAALLPPGTRATPALAAQAGFAEFTSGIGSLPPVRAVPRAAFYRLERVRVGFDCTVSLPNVAISLGGSGSVYNRLDSIPHHLVLSQVVAGEGCPTQQLKRTVAGNAAHLMIVDSWLDGAKKIGQEAQAFQAHNTPGPILVRNTYLAGAAQSFLLGGADPSISQLRICDVTVEDSYFHLPRAWSVFKSPTTGNRYLVKTRWELKNACRVRFVGNVLDGNRAGGFTGIILAIKSANQNGNCQWCATSDVEVAYNRFLNTGGGIAVTGGEAYGQTTSTGEPSIAGPTARIFVHDNVIEAINADPDYQGEGRSWRIGSAQDLTIVRNTTHNCDSGWAGFMEFIGSSLKNPATIVGNTGCLRTFGFFKLGTFGAGTVPRGNALVGTAGPPLSVNNKLVPTVAALDQLLAAGYPAAAHESGGQNWQWVERIDSVLVSVPTIPPVAVWP